MNGRDQVDGRAIRRALLEGDPGGARELHARCVRPLYAFSFHRLGRDHHAAEEVVQETLLLALERIEDYDPDRGDLHTWLAFLSRNVIRRANETRRRAEPFDEQGLEALVDPGVPLGEALLAAPATKARVAWALARLPERWRRVLEQKYLQGCPVKKIAEAESTTEKAVESLLARAREAFRIAFLEESAPAAEAGARAESRHGR